MLTFAIDNVRCILWWIYSPTCNGSSINNWYPTPVNNTTHIICNIGHYITNRTTNYLLRTGDISHATKFIIRSHISITNSPDTLCRWKTRKSLILARLRCLVAKTNSIHVVRSSSVATIAKIFESTSVTVTTLNVFHLSYCSKITDKKKHGTCMSVYPSRVAFVDYTLFPINNISQIHSLWIAQTYQWNCEKFGAETLRISMCRKYLCIVTGGSTVAMC